jgi:hypothetical protein
MDNHKYRKIRTFSTAALNASVSRPCKKDNISMLSSQINKTRTKYFYSLQSKISHKAFDGHKKTSHSCLRDDNTLRRYISESSSCKSRFSRVRRAALSLADPSSCSKVATLLQILSWSASLMLTNPNTNTYIT